jgi:hypothetical protein
MDLRSAATALIQSVANPELEDIVAEAGDISLDAVIRSGALEAVPIVQWIVKSGRAASAIREEIFFRKVCRFLTPTVQIPRAKREAFAKKIGDSKYQEKVGEAFLLWLDKLNSMEKVVLLARVFRSFLLDMISFEEAVHFADIIDHAHLPYLRLLTPSPFHPHSPQVPSDSAAVTHLTSLGLMQFEAKWELVDRQFKRDVSPRSIELLRFSLTPTAHRFSRVVLTDATEDAAP